MTPAWRPERSSLVRTLSVRVTTSASILCPSDVRQDASPRGAGLTQHVGHELFEAVIQLGEESLGRTRMEVAWSIAMTARSLICRTTPTQAASSPASRVRNASSWQTNLQAIARRPGPATAAGWANRVTGSPLTDEPGQKTRPPPSSPPAGCSASARTFANASS